ncbi:MAG: hypothetical protein HYV67_01835 [Candidatus Taylorbacteria bacterium]|nr:hypothetical protein [Candidatus Taylorbacteria bacterium]
MNTSNSERTDTTKRQNTRGFIVEVQTDHTVISIQDESGFKVSLGDEVVEQGRAYGTLYRGKVVTLYDGIDGNPIIWVHWPDERGGYTSDRTFEKLKNQPPPAVVKLFENFIRRRKERKDSGTHD